MPRRFSGSEKTRSSTPILHGTIFPLRISPCIIIRPRVNSRLSPTASWRISIGHSDDGYTLPIKTRFRSSFMEIPIYSARPMLLQNFFPKRSADSPSCLKLGSSFPSTVLITSLIMCCTMKWSMRLCMASFTTNSAPACSPAVGCRFHSGLMRVWPNTFRPDGTWNRICSSWTSPSTAKCRHPARCWAAIWHTKGDNHFCFSSPRRTVIRSSPNSFAISSPPNRSKTQLKKSIKKSPRNSAKNGSRS